MADYSTVTQNECSVQKRSMYNNLERLWKIKVTEFNYF